MATYTAFDLAWESSEYESDYLVRFVFFLRLPVPSLNGMLVARHGEFVCAGRVSPSSPATRSGSLVVCKEECVSAQVARRVAEVLASVMSYALASHVSILRPSRPLACRCAVACVTPSWGMAPGGVDDSDRQPIFRTWSTESSVTVRSPLKGYRFSAANNYCLRCHRQARAHPRSRGRTTSSTYRSAAVSGLGEFA